MDQEVLTEIGKEDRDLCSCTKYVRSLPYYDPSTRSVFSYNYFFAKLLPSAQHIITDQDQIYEMISIEVGKMKP